MIVDYHMHLRAPDESIEHTVEAVEPYVEAAADADVDEIGFTEHVYYFEQTRHLWSMPYHLERCVYDIEPYVDAVVEAKRRGYPVKLGIEVDYEPGREEETAEALAPYPWDYVLGSIHFLDGLGIDAEPSLVDSLGAEGAWRRYYEALGRARAQRALRLARASRPREDVRRGDRVGLGHGRGLARRRRDRGLERRPAQAAREALPEPGSASQLRGREACRSRSPRTRTCPQNVGRDLDRAIEHARAAGYETVTVFDRREARQEPLG